MKKFDAPSFISSACSFLKNTMHKQRFSRVVVAVSGGVDSAVVASLCVSALGRDNVIVVLLPCGDILKDAYDRSREMVRHLDIPAEGIVDLNIAPHVERLCSYDPDMSDIRKANIMARIRMVLLYDVARKYNCLVVGTENKSEYVLGYFTRFGDEASDIELIRSLYKTQVYDVARYLLLPDSIITAPPSAGLWNNQTDEIELGFSYETGDTILYLLMEKKLTEKQIVAHGHDPVLVARVVERVRLNAFKHHAPYVFEYKITSSPRRRGSIRK